MTGAEVAEALGMSPSKISRIETGSRGLRVADVAALLGHYEVPEQKRAQPQHRSGELCRGGVRRSRCRRPRRQEHRRPRPHLPATSWSTFLR